MNIKFIIKRIGWIWISIMHRYKGLKVIRSRLSNVLCSQKKFILAIIHP